VSDLRRIYRVQRWEFWLSMSCFAGVAIFGAIPGIALAIVVAVIEFLWDGWRPHSAVLGSVDDVKGYHDITRYPGARLIPGLVLFRWDAPLFFANAELFRDRVLAAAASSPTPVRSIIVAAEPVTSIDVTAADILRELDETLDAAGIDLCFAEMKDPVKDKLKRFGLFSRFGETNLFATIEEAVDSYRARSLGDAGRDPDLSDRRPSDDAQANVQVVRDLYAAFARHDIGAILAVLSPDVEWSEPESPFNPCGGTRRGHAGFLEWARLGHESEEVLSLEPLVFLTGGSRVAIVGHTRCRAKSTGRTYATDFVHLATFDQGRVIRFQEFFDTHAVAEAFRAQ
jgi:ketosteroid isomerase-like protein/anti-anti-sigma regulatory factor